MKLNTMLGLFFVFAFFLSGCGETIGGMGKDTSRVMRGTKTIFVSGN